MNTEHDASKRPRKKTTPSKGQSSALRHFNLASVTGTVVSLHSVEFTLHVSDDMEKFAHNLSCTVRNVIAGEQQSVGYCDFAISRVLDGTTVSEIKASYIYILRSDTIHNEEERKASLEIFAKLSLWPRFKGLFGMINLQSDADFPKLPMNIPSIKFQDVSLQSVENK